MPRTQDRIGMPSAFGSYPFIDTTYGGSVEGVITAVDRILGMIDPATKIISGHGPLMTWADLQDYRAMLATIRDRVAGFIREKKTLAEIQASKPTADLDGRWKKDGITPEMLVRMVYVSLTDRGW